MQRIHRINLLSRNQAVRSDRRKDLTALKKQWREHDYNALQIQRASNKNIKAERKHRREDWMLGDLAPKRDAGANKGVYGTMDQVLVRGSELPSRVSQGPRSAGHDLTGGERWGQDEDEDIVPEEWAGEGQAGNIVSGDRVVVIRGRDEGQIGLVKEVDLPRHEITVEGLNMVSDGDIVCNQLTISRPMSQYQNTHPEPRAKVNQTSCPRNWQFHLMTFDLCIVSLTPTRAWIVMWLYGTCEVEHHTSNVATARIFLDIQDIWQAQTFQLPGLKRLSQIPREHPLTRHEGTLNNTRGRQVSCRTHLEATLQLQVLSKN